MGNLRAAVNASAAVLDWGRADVPAQRVDAGPYPVVFVRDPGAVAEVLDGRAPGVCERGRFYDEVGRVIGTTSIVTASGAAHRRIRRLVEPSFRPAALHGYADVMTDSADAMQPEWRDGGRLRLDEAMQRLTLEIAARCFLGDDHSGGFSDISAVLDAGTKVFYRLLLPSRVSELLWRIPWLPANRCIAQARERIDAELARVVAQRRAAPSSGTLLDVLLEQGLSAEELRDQLVTFVFAGHETTAQALTWAFVLLARFPDVAGAVRDEVASQLGGRSPGADDIAQLPYTRAVFRETLRLCPPAWFLSREADRDTTVAGCPAPRRALVMVSPLALHRDRRYWSSPDEFRPERWLDGEYERAAYVPFGRGVRSCIGSSFATTEGVLVLASVVPHWTMTLERRVRARGTTTLRPAHPVWVGLQRRA